MGKNQLVDSYGRYPSYHTVRILCRHLFYLFFLFKMKLLVCLAAFCFLLNIRSATGQFQWQLGCTGCEGKKSWQDDYCARDYRYHGCYKSKCWKQCDHGGSRWCYTGLKHKFNEHYVQCDSSQPDVGRFCYLNTNTCSTKCY